MKKLTNIRGGPCFPLWHAHALVLLGRSDTIKRLMSYLKCRSVEVINNPARPGLNHREVNYIKLQIINGKELKRTFEMRY
jgi:hypothetical protein